MFDHDIRIRIAGEGLDSYAFNRKQKYFNKD